MPGWRHVWPAPARRRKAAQAPVRASVPGLSGQWRSSGGEGRRHNHIPLYVSPDGLDVRFATEIAVKDPGMGLNSSVRVTRSRVDLRVTRGRGGGRDGIPAALQALTY